MVDFAWKSVKKESNFKNRGQQRTAIIKHICRAADSKWLLTPTMSLLLHQTKLVFKGNLSYISDAVCQLFQWHHYHLQYFLCVSPSALQCIFSHLNFTPRNIFTPTYRCNGHRDDFVFFFSVCRASNGYLCAALSLEEIVWIFTFFSADTLKSYTLRLNI